MARKKKSGKGASGADADAGDKKSPATESKAVIPDVVPPSEAPKGKLEKLPWARTLAWILGAGLLVLLVVFIVKSRGKDEKEPTVAVEQLYPPVDTSGLTCILTDTVRVLVTKPFYTTWQSDSLRSGDLVAFKAEGIYGCDRFYRYRGEGDNVGPQGFTKRPIDLNSAARKPGFPLETAPLWALVAGFGKLEYDEHRTPTLVGSEHFLVGREAYVRVPEGVTPKLHLALNERWIEPAWNDNKGRVTAYIRVYRKT